MPRRIFDLDQPDRFVSGTVGQPGSRVFFLQARRGPTVVSVVVEKVQVQLLAERLGLLLGELARRGVRVPEALAPHDDDTGPLDEPLVEAFRSTTLTIAWDPSREQIILEARGPVEDDDDEDDEDEMEVAAGLARALEFEIISEPEEVEGDPSAEDEEDQGDDEDEDAEDEDEEAWSDDDPDGPDLLRVRLTPLKVRAFVERALRVVAGGRPPCPLCGRPLDPGGHICPRRNGYVH